MTISNAPTGIYKNLITLLVEY